MSFAHKAFDKPTLLVTGGLGFLGSRFVTLVHDRFKDVYILDNAPADKKAPAGDNIHVIRGDITKEETFARLPANIDFVAHFAAAISVQESMTNPEKYRLANVVGSGNVFRWAQKANCRSLVATSSAAVYGNTGSSAAIHERLPYGGVSPYALSKWQMEELAASMFPTYSPPGTAGATEKGANHMRINFIRPFNIYGPGQAPGGYAGFISQALAALGKETPVVVFGDGAQTRDFVFVDDVCQSVHRLLIAGTRDITDRVKPVEGDTPSDVDPMRDPKHLEVFNVGTGKSITIGNLAKRLVDIVHEDTGKPRSVDGRHIEFKPARDGDILYSLADVSALRDVTGWAPAVTLDDGLKRTWEWFRREHVRDKV